MVRKSGPRLTLTGQRKTALDGQTISYIVKRSANAKHIRLEVRSETGLTVVIPKSYNARYIPDLLEAKRGWILSKLAKYDQLRSHRTENELKSGDTLTYLGQHLEVVVQQNHGSGDSVRLERNKLIVVLRAENGRLDLALERWYRMQAADLIRGKVERASAHLGLTYNRVIIRGQKTRWGSCSHKGNLSFNWKLIMAPEPVIDYVIIHELAHLREMNHTKRFWGLVAEHCPQWREHKKWLRDHGANLCYRFCLSKTPDMAWERLDARLLLGHQGRTASFLQELF
jgi:predicted metal-dependent hydrolase